MEKRIKQEMMEKTGNLAKNKSRGKTAGEKREIKKLLAAGGAPGKPTDDKGNLTTEMSKYEKMNKMLNENQLKTPEEYSEKRDVLRARYITAPDSILNEMAEVVKKKDGENAAAEFLNRHDAEKINHDIPSEVAWNRFCQLDGEEGGRVCGFTIIPRNHIFVSPYTADGGEIQISMTYLHEKHHLKSVVRTLTINEGFCEDKSYISINANESTRKAMAYTSDPDYRNYVEISRLTEKIIGREDYLYAHAVGGDEYLKKTFDEKVKTGDESEFIRIFGVDRYGNDLMDNQDKIDLLRKFSKKIK
jgi:hypothetical protein